MFGEIGDIPFLTIVLLIFLFIFSLHLKLELQFPALNDEKYYFL